MSKMAQLAVRYKKRIIELEEENQKFKSVLEGIAAEGDNCLIASDLAAELIKRAKDVI